MTIEAAITLLKTAGYRVSKPRITRPSLARNAIGKPYGASYDPNYRMKYRPRQYAPRGGSVENCISPQQWTRMCQEAQAAWDAKHNASNTTEA